MHQFRRPRRNRKSASLRSLVEETTLSLNDIISPLFVCSGEKKREAIASMPGIFRYSLDELLKEIEEQIALGVHAFCLFPALPDELKDSLASEALKPEGLYLQTLKKVKEEFPQITLMTDIALDPYSSDGHDGLVDPETGTIKNDETLSILGKMGVLQAQMGADILGPSDMMDGRVGFIRNCLEEAGHTETLIMSYTAKYASGFYGPFRDALESAPKAGDKKTYQMNPANWREAIVETQLDEAEGADILMVKPGLPYLDILVRMREATPLPLSVYNVSGEYAMIKAAGEKGWLDETTVMLESLTGFKRAGADLILTYFAKDLALSFKKL